MTPDKEKQFTEYMHVTIKYLSKTRVPKWKKVEYLQTEITKYLDSCKVMQLALYNQIITGTNSFSTVTNAVALEYYLRCIEYLTNELAHLASPTR